jgi:dienelactone hydrolase
VDLLKHRPHGGGTARGVLLAAALLHVLVATACMNSATTTAYKADPAAVANRVPGAPPPPAPPPPALRVERGQGFAHYDVLDLHRPDPCGYAGEDALGAIAYLSRDAGPKSWVIVLPIWGSSTYPPRKLVSWLTHGPRRATTNVLWVQNPGRARLMDYPAMEAATTVPEFMAALEKSAACIGAASDDIRSWVSWILEQQGTDPRRIGIVGCSIGAIVANLTMGRDPRISAGAFVMGGGRLDEILTICYGAEAEVRKAMCQRLGWDDEVFHQAVKGPLEAVEPLRFAANIDPAGVLFIDAGEDACIPKDARDELWEAMGRPERVTLGYSHRNSFLTMTFLGFDRTTERIVDFLDARLTGPLELTEGKASPGKVGAQAP